MPDELSAGRKRQKHLHGLYIIGCVLAVLIILFAATARSAAFSPDFPATS